MRSVLLLIGLASLGACKKKAPEEAVPRTVASVDQQLQIALVIPSSIPAQTPHPLQIVGTAFQRGAEVRIGDSWIQGVVFETANTLKLTAPALPDGRYDVTVQNFDGGSTTLWAGLIVGSGGGEVTALQQPCAPVVVYFGVDVAGLDEAGATALSSEASCYVTWPGKIRIEGHADERGTTDYNLSLGERRAEAVRRQLHTDGIALHQMTTTSYGEERPADPGSGELSWSKNRRVEVRPVQ